MADISGLNLLYFEQREKDIFSFARKNGKCDY